jgi:hypothetical protein
VEQTVAYFQFQDNTITLNCTEHRHIDYLEKSSFYGANVVLLLFRVNYNDPMYICKVAKCIREWNPGVPIILVATMIDLREDRKRRETDLAYGRMCTTYEGKRLAKACRCTDYAETAPIRFEGISELQEMIICAFAHKRKKSCKHQ